MMCISLAVGLTPALCRHVSDICPVNMMPVYLLKSTGLDSVRSVSHHWQGSY